MVLVKNIFLGIFSVAAVLLVLAVLVRLLENWITFHPWRELELRPENYGLSAEQTRIRSGRGDTIHGWYFKPARADAQVIVFFHGNAGNISHRLDLLAPFVRRGLGVLLFDYRGFGLSTGKPSEKAFQQDALAVWDYLTRVKGIATEQLVAFGRSLGGAPATYLAAERKVGRLVLEGSFTSGRDTDIRFSAVAPGNEKPLGGEPETETGPGTGNDPSRQAGRGGAFQSRGETGQARLCRPGGFLGGRGRKSSRPVRSARRILLRAN